MAHTAAVSPASAKVQGPALPAILEGQCSSNNVEFSMQAGMCPCAVPGSRREKAQGGRSLLGLAAPSTCATAAQTFCPAGEQLTLNSGPEHLQSMQPCHMVCRKGLTSERRKGYLHLSVFSFSVH